MASNVIIILGTYNMHYLLLPKETCLFAYLSYLYTKETKTTDCVVLQYVYGYCRELVLNNVLKFADFWCP